MRHRNNPRVKLLRDKVREQDQEIEELELRGVVGAQDAQILRLHAEIVRLSRVRRG